MSLDLPGRDTGVASLWKENLERLLLLTVKGSSLSSALCCDELGFSEEDSLFSSMSGANESVSEPEKKIKLCKDAYC